MKEVFKFWMDYQGSGTPYGNTLEGFMNWVAERLAEEAANAQ